MATITLNCKDITWLQVERGEIAVGFYKADGFEDMVVLSKYDCAYFSTQENLDGLVDEIEERAEQPLCEEDRLYLKRKLWSTLDAWSLDDDTIYC